MADTADKVVKIKVIGVGGAGNNVINRMIASDVKGVEFVAVNTDKQDLEKSKCKNKVQIGEKLTGGMGAGSKPDIGQKSAEESKALISQVLEGTDMVFITAGIRKVTEDMKVLKNKLKDWKSESCPMKSEDI